MAEIQKNPTGKIQSTNYESSSRITANNDREGKAQGNPSYTKEEDMSKKNKEGRPDERKIQGDDLKKDQSRRDGGSL